MTFDLQRPIPAWLWVLLMGGIGFAAGFFGPLALNPDANQGPLLGIFYSGPRGAVLGLLLYAACRIARPSGGAQWLLLGTSGTVLCVVTLYYCLPEPALRGYILDAQIQGCSAPVQAADDAVAYWEGRVTEVTWAAPRSNWQADSRLRLQVDDGAVLALTVFRQMSVYESRKPWNRGNLSSSQWQSLGDQKNYYAQYAGGSCAAYPPGSRSQYFISYSSLVPTVGPQDWPPREPATFLDLQTIEPVPAEFQDLPGRQ